MVKGIESLRLELESCPLRDGKILGYRDIPIIDSWAAYRAATGITKGSECRFLERTSVEPLKIVGTWIDIVNRRNLIRPRPEDLAGVALVLIGRVQRDWVTGLKGCNTADLPPTDNRI